MGDDIILIQNASEKSLEESTQDFDEWFKHWFEWTRPWQPLDVNHKRLVWTRWIRVPVHAWSVRFFKNISSSLGSFIKLDALTENKSRLDQARVLLSVSFLKDVNQTFNVNIDGNIFPIKISEDIWFEESNSNEEGEDDDESTSHWSENPESDSSSGPAKAIFRGRIQSASKSVQPSLEEEKSVNMGNSVAVDKRNDEIGGPNREQTLCNLEDNNQNKGTQVEDFSCSPLSSKERAELVEVGEPEHLIATDVDGVGPKQHINKVLWDKEHTGPTCFGPYYEVNGSGHSLGIILSSNGPQIIEPNLCSHDLILLKNPSFENGPVNTISPKNRACFSEVNIHLSDSELNPSSQLQVGVTNQVQSETQVQSRKISKKAKKKIEKEEFNKFVGNMESPSERNTNLHLNAPGENHNLKTGVSNPAETHRKEAIETWEMGKELGLVPLISENEIISRIEKVFDKVEGQVFDDKEQGNAVS